MIKEKLMEKVDRYIRISQSPLGEKYRMIVANYQQGNVSPLEFIQICDSLSSNGRRSGFMTKEDRHAKETKKENKESIS